MRERFLPALARSFDPIDRYVIDGFWHLLAVGLVALGEALRMAYRGRLQGAWIWAIGLTVAFGIWTILRVPDTLMGVLGGLAGRFGH